MPIPFHLESGCVYCERDRTNLAVREAARLVLVVRTEDYARLLRLGRELRASTSAVRRSLSGSATQRGVAHSRHGGACVVAHVAIVEGATHSIRRGGACVRRSHRHCHRAHLEEQRARDRREVPLGYRPRVLEPRVAPLRQKLADDRQPHRHGRSVNLSPQ